MSFNRMFIPSQKYQILLCTVRPYQVFFYSKILATLLPVIYCRNALKLELTKKKYNLLVLVHFYRK